MACNGLKKGSFHLFVHPKWFVPKKAHLQRILRFWEGQNGQPRAQNTPKTLVLAFHVVQGLFLKKKKVFF